MEDKPMNYPERKTKVGKRISIGNITPATCNHVYGEVFYDPETIEINSNEVWMGHENSCSYETRDRWSKTCEKCGETVSTTRIGAIACAPIFD